MYQHNLLSYLILFQSYISAIKTTVLKILNMTFVCFNPTLVRLKPNNIYLMPDIIAWAKIPGMNTSDFIDTTRAMGLVDNLITTYKSDTTIFGWEVRHEGLNNLATRFYPSASIDSMMQWYKSIHDSLKRLDTNHLVSTSADVYTSYHCAEISSTYDLSDIEDFFDFQFYKDPFYWNAQKIGNKDTYGPNSYSLVSYYGVRDFMRSSSGRDMAGKPMMLGEVGYSSGGSSNEQKQFEYFDMLGKLVNSNQIAGFVFWSIRDRSSTTSTRMYGLFNNTGTEKMVGYWYDKWTISSEQYDIWK